MRGPRPPPEPAAPGLGGLEGLPLPAAGHRGSQPLLVQSVPARRTGPPFARPRPPRGPPSPGCPLPLAAEVGTARQPGALRGAGFPTRLRGPSRCARSLRPPSGLGTGEGAWGAWPGGPSLPGAQGAVAGTPQRFPSQSPAWDLARVRRAGGRGRPGHPEPRPAFGAATQRGPGSPLQLPPGQASRGRREGAVRGGAVQTCWERSLGSDL